MQAKPPTEAPTGQPPRRRRLSNAHADSLSPEVSLASQKHSPIKPRHHSLVTMEGLSGSPEPFGTDVHRSSTKHQRSAHGSVLEGFGDSFASNDFHNSGAMKHRRSLPFEPTPQDTPPGVRTDSSPAISRGGVGVSLNTRALQTLRKMARQPRESRIWGISEVKGAEVLGSAERYKRFDTVSLRKLCFAAELRTFRKGCPLCLQGEDQMEAMLVVGGSVSVRVKPVEKVTGSWTRETEIPNNLQAEVLGDEIFTVQPGETVGFWTLVTSWQRWPASYLATSKVEVVCFSLQDCQPMLQTLSCCFDGSTPLQILQGEHINAVESQVDEQLPKVDLNLAAEPGMAEAVRLDLAESLRGVPFFRQFEAEAVMAMIPSMEVVDIQERTVLWEQDAQPRDKTGASESPKRAHASAHLHVVMRGAVRVFRRNVSTLSDTPLNQRITTHNHDIKQLWERPSDLLTSFGPCLFTLLPGDSFGGPSLSAAHSLIVDGDTQLIRIKKYDTTVGGAEGVSIVFQQETLRQLLMLPPDKRTSHQRQHLIHILQQGLEFFRHVATTHAAKLVESAVFRRFSRGDAIIRQGQKATRVYIVLNGIAVQYQSSRKRVPAWVWHNWEAFRHREDVSELGERVRVVHVGRSIGEAEVVEQDLYRTTVLAEDEVEMLEISSDTYHTVLWDLCDGKAIPTSLIRHTLSLAPDQRDKQDLDMMLKLLDESDFLTQFSQDMQRHLTRAMHIEEVPPNSVVVQQGRTGHKLFLCISGSVALHKRESKTGPVDAEGSNSVVDKYGGCTRVLGIGDSFGELAFVQGRSHPATAFTRTDCILLCIDRDQLDAWTLERVQSFVSSPRKEVIDALFRKPLEDRNENDAMLLINYMELNPFMKSFSYPVMIDCAHTIRRQVAESGYAVGEDGEVSERQVCIVNRGSILASPKHPGAQISVKNDEDGSQTLLQKLNSYRYRYREKHDEYVFFGFLWQNNELSTVTLSRNANVTARFSRKVFAIDTNGDLTYTESIENGTLTELGHVSEIHTLERITLPKFQFALNIGIRGDNHILAANFRTECDHFVDAICLFHPYFEQRFAKSKVAFTGTLSMCMSSNLETTPLEWKMLQFKLTGDGELSYSSGQNPEDEDHWYVVGMTSDLLSSVPIAVKDKPWAMELVFNPRRLSHPNHQYDSLGHYAPKPYRFVLASLSKSERETWLDHFGLKSSKTALHSRYRDEYGKEPQIDQAVVMLHKLLLHVVLRKRARRARAYQHLSRAATGVSRSPNSPRSPTATSFVGYGSAFSFAGAAVANEACELFLLTRGQWDAVKKREVAQQIDDLVALLGEIPSLQLATPRELTGLAVNAHLSSHFAGELLPCESLSTKHVHLIQDGLCTLRRARMTGTAKRSRPLRPHAEADGGAGSEADSAENKDSLCGECGGKGLRSGVVNSKSLLERVDLCPTCNGTGEVHLPEGNPLRKIDGHVTELAVLRRPALLHESVAVGEDLALYELVGSTKFALLSLRKDQWDEIQNKRLRAGLAAPEPQAGWLAQQQIANAHTVMDGIRRGHMTMQQERTFAKAVSLEQRAQMASGKEHSRRAKSINVLLGSKPADDKRFEIPRVKDRRDVMPKHCALAPPSTVVNPFRHELPPVEEPPVHESEMKEALLDGLLSGSARPSVTLSPISPVPPRTPRTPRSPMRPESVRSSSNIMHMLTPRREVTSVAFHRPQKLKYGNRYDLDPRQQKIHIKISSMLKHENFSKYSTIHNFNDSAHPVPTVNMFEWFEALKSSDLLRDRPTDNAVYELRAISKADAMKLFWKAVHELGGELQGGARLGIDAFHSAVQDVCRLLQVPLDGKPDGRATMARKQGQGEDGDFARRLGLKRGTTKAWLSPLKRRDQMRDESDKLARMESYALRYLAIRPG